jgi:3-hydroxybutyryl-CoA dehydrogenase
MSSEVAASSPARGGAALREVFVLGAGIMGSGIAAQCALAGYSVTLGDVTPELARRGRESAERALEHAVAKGAVPPTARARALEHLREATGTAAAASADVVVEAVPEDLALKRRVFAELERAALPGAILASNTSSLPIARIGEGLADPGRLVGLHFFNPVLQMPLLELIAGPRTRADVVAGAKAFGTSLGKTVVTSRDTPGFVTTRALAVLVNEAARMLEEGVATRDDIDAAYRLGFHHPMGPFELVDLVGIDTAVAILDVLWEGFQDSRYRASPLLRAKVEEKKLGRKTGEGFYTYPRAPPSA